MSQGNAKTNTIARPVGPATGDLSGNYPNPTVSKLQNHAVSSVAPLDGYVLTWDNTDGYWYAAILPTQNGAVVFDAGTVSKNIVTSRPAHKSAIDDTKNGIVNLSSDTTDATVGATGNYSTIIGGDRNVSSGDYSAVIGGLQNTASGNYSVAGGNGSIASDFASVSLGSSNSASGNSSICLGNASSSAGDSSMVMAFSSIANGFASTALGVQSWSSRDGQLAFSSAGDNIDVNILGAAQNGNMVYAAKQSTIGSSFVVTNVSQDEFNLIGGNSPRYYSINIRILAMAANANIGPATWIYEVLAHVAGGFSIIDVQSTVLTADPHTTGWLTSITVSGTDSLLHINIDPNGDVTNTINAVADIKWVELKGFGQ